MQNSWLNTPVDQRILFKSPPSDRWKLATRLLGVDVTQLGGDAENGRRVVAAEDRDGDFALGERREQRGHFGANRVGEGECGEEGAVVGDAEDREAGVEKRANGGVGFEGEPFGVAAL